MKAVAKESDAQILRRAMRTLGMTQVKIGTMLGISQPKVSRIFALDRGLRRTERIELERRLAQHAAMQVLESGQALKLPPCRGHTITKLDQFMRHIEICPMCMVRAFNSIVLKRK